MHDVLDLSDDTEPYSLDAMIETHQREANHRFPSTEYEQRFEIAERLSDGRRKKAQEDWWCDSC